MQITAGVDFMALKATGYGHLIDINPVTGNQMYHLYGNDVAHVIDFMGGKATASIKLGVEMIELEHWVDDHYVPTRYAERIHALTGWSIWSIQEAPCGAKLV